MFSTDYANLDNAYTKPDFEFSRTMYPVHKEVPFPNIQKMIPSSLQPENANNADLVAKTGITTNWQYRKYLTENAKDIMEYNYRDSNNENGLAVRNAALPVMQCNKVTGMINTPRIQTSTMYGAPIQATTNDGLKNAYLASVAYHSASIAPSVDPNQFRR